jgi:hypothetical protein
VLFFVVLSSCQPAWTTLLFGELLRQSPNNSLIQNAMRRKIMKIRFVCESCKKSVSPRKVRRWGGKCWRCPGESWTLHGKFVSKEIGMSWWAFFLSMTTGLGWISIKRLTSQMSAQGLTPDVAMKLTENLKQTPQLVTEYLRIRKRELERQQGANSCRACHAIYIPVEGNEWNKAGFCSKVCWVQGETQAEAVHQERFAHLERQGYLRPAEKPPTTVTPQKYQQRQIKVKCPAGHEFEVISIYSGCVRACPHCQQKCEIP